MGNQDLNKKNIPCMKKNCQIRAVYVNCMLNTLTNFRREKAYFIESMCDQRTLLLTIHIVSLLHLSFSNTFTQTNLSFSMAQMQLVLKLPVVRSSAVVLPWNSSCSLAIFTRMRRTSSPMYIPLIIFSNLHINKQKRAI